MNLASAQNNFLSLVNSLNDQDRTEFVSWCRERCENGSLYSKAYFDLRTIAEDIKTLVPMDAIFPSEKINNLNLVDKSGYTNAPIVHVDSFLFEDDHIDALVEEGKLSRNYCKNCGSRDIAPITFISHSASIQRIEFIFRYMLPDLKDKMLLDVGSRLGAILYGAYYLSSASKIIGVELNEDLSNIQKHIIQKYGLNDRIEVICTNIYNVPDVLRAAHVIILNNVFECFMSKEEQKNIWIWLRKIITNPGVILVTVPSMEETLNGLDTGIDIYSWLRKIPLNDPEAIIKMDDQELLSEICCYTVI